MEPVDMTFNRYNRIFGSLANPGAISIIIMAIYNWRRNMHVHSHAATRAPYRQLTAEYALHEQL